MCKANLIFVSTKIAYTGTPELDKIIQSCLCRNALIHSYCHCSHNFGFSCLVIVDDSYFWDEKEQQAWKLNQEMKMKSYGVWHLSVPYPHTSLFAGTAEVSVTFSFFTSELFTLVADNNMRQRIAWFLIFETQGSDGFSNMSQSAWGLATGDENLALRGTKACSCCFFTLYQEDQEKK